jgi:hypothetical protein
MKIEPGRGRKPEGQAVDDTDRHSNPPAEHSLGPPHQRPGGKSKQHRLRYQQGDGRGEECVERREHHENRMEVVPQQVEPFALEHHDGRVQ